MRKLVFSAFASVILLGAGLALARGKTFTGEIYDSQCAKMGSHEEMLKKEGMGDKKDDPMARKMCTLNCVKMGGKYVLLEAAKQAVYQLDDQKKPEQFAGQKVKVTGTLDQATQTIHVTNIQPAS